MKLKSRYILFFFFTILFFAYSQTASAIEIAVTVDDLPVHGPLPPNTTRMDIAKQMLAVFKKHHIKNVYGFVIGKNVDSNTEEILQTWMANGQLLGNHTFSHLDLAQVTSQQYIIDIKKNNPLLAKFMKNKNYRYLRYPFLSEGNTQEKRDVVRHFLFKNHYAIAPVTVDFFDYEWNVPYARCMEQHNQQAIDWLEKSYLQQSIAAITVAHSLSELLFHRDIKYVLLIHIGAMDAVMLDKLLTAYEKQDVKFIPLPVALQDDAYQINPNIVRNRAYTFLNQIRLAKGLKNPDNVDKIYASLPEAKLNTICR